MIEPYPLPDLADGTPCGPDLELDPAFGELERSAQGKPEVQFGDTVQPPIPPEWQETVRLAEELLGRTRDLRILALLAIARLHLAGLPGFSSVLASIPGLLEEQWEHVHPRLDPEDDNDPLFRANALIVLADPAQVLRPMRDTPLTKPARGRAVTWRDIAILNGALEPEQGRERLNEAAIRDSFARTDPAHRLMVRAAVMQASGDIVAITKCFETRARPDSRPTKLDDLAKLLRDIERELDRFEPPSDEIPEDTEPETAAEEGDQVPEPVAAAVRARASVATIQSIRSVGTRGDALYALELAAAYFRANEPTSPLPLLIERARRLADLPFLEILREIAPDGLPQAQIVTGTANE
jgi:type VI secretion system protein ImpA